MALLRKHHIKDDEMGPGKKYTHFGLFYGFVPVYIGDPSGECHIAVRNWWPEWLLDVCDVVFDIACSIAMTMDPTYEPAWPMVIQGEILHG